MSDILNKHCVGPESGSSLPFDPAAVAGVATALDRLGAAERASAPADLESRIARATMPARPVLHFEGCLEGRVVVAAQVSRSWTPIRMAAAIGLFSALTAAYIASRDSSSSDTGTGRIAALPTDDIADAAVTADLLVLAAVFEDSPSLAEIESLRADAATLEEAIHSDDGFIDGGAM